MQSKAKKQASNSRAYLLLHVGQMCKKETRVQRFENCTRLKDGGAAARTTHEVGNNYEWVTEPNHYIGNCRNPLEDTIACAFVNMC